MLCRIGGFTAVILRMPSSGLVRLVSLVRTDVSEEHIASICRIEGLRDLEQQQNASYC
jgi:hypothetical protein